MLQGITEPNIKIENVESLDEGKSNESGHPIESLSGRFDPIPV